MKMKLGLVSLAAAMALAACGGGGGDNRAALAKLAGGDIDPTATPVAAQPIPTQPLAPPEPQTQEPVATMAPVQIYVTATPAPVPAPVIISPVEPVQSSGVVCVTQEPYSAGGGINDAVAGWCN